MSRHPVPAKRRHRRGAILWMCAAVALAVVLAVILMTTETATCIEKGDEESTIHPQEIVIHTEEPEGQLVNRYDVPLDGDLQDYISEQCEIYGIDPALVYGIISVESDFDESLVGDNGNSWGLMQIYATQHTARCIRLGAWNLLDAKANIRVGVDFLAELFALGHDESWVLSWYNGHGGSDCEYSRLVLAEADRIRETASASWIGGDV